jgi:D-alanyl-lipoteichoic acid acyltransferase DltB (MBOAT superfamily)
MLFNSNGFIFLFLPITLLVYLRIARQGRPLHSAAWLVAASLFFYGWWNPRYLALILASMAFNYAVGRGLGEWPSRKTRKALLIIGIAGNLGALGYFKYAGFFADNLNAALGTGFMLEPIVLPLAISFFTFQQIAYLIDSYRHEAFESNIVRYALFVTFFPQLIAGPIVHHGEMLPQFRGRKGLRFSSENMAVGSSIFFIGLAKKSFIADGVSPWADAVFGAAAQGVPLTTIDAWCGVLAYTFQLYFDFSGYSDMAIGLGRMFGIRLPLNFRSPYKAINVVDFWRRWHMTLSRFLRDYVYFALGGNRKGRGRRYVNLMATMLLGGLWHGAGWTFVIWGGLHGLYLVVNHAWRAVITTWLPGRKPTTIGTWAARVCTFLAVTVGWVLFRADSLSSATAILRSMAGGGGGVVLEPSYREMLNRLFHLGDALASLGVRYENLEYYGGVEQVAILATLLGVVWFLPNTQQIMRGFNPGLNPVPEDLDPRGSLWLRWSVTPRWAWAIATIAVVGVLHVTRHSEFLYFQF